MAFDPETINQLSAGATGSAAATWIAKATGWELIGMFLTGLSAAHFTGPAIAALFNLNDQKLAIGWVVGFLAVLVLRRLIAGIESIPTESIGGILLSKLRKWSEK